MGRHRHEEMDMILRDRTGDDFHVLGLTYFSEKISKALSHLSVQHLLPVLGNPDQVVLEVVHRMRRCPVVLHFLMLLKSSPKGEGFTPRRGH